MRLTSLGPVPSGTAAIPDTMPPGEAIADCTPTTSQPSPAGSSSAGPDQPGPAPSGQR